jgi:hypothetical protein
MMLRTFIVALVALFVFAGGLLAGDTRGKIKSIQPDQMTVTVTSPDGKDHQYTFAKDAKFFSAAGDQFKDGLKDKHFKKGAYVFIHYEMKNGHEVFTQMKLVQPKRGAS